jgi:hypothetical protein
VERLDPEVAAQVPDRGERGEVVAALEAADAGAAAVVEVEVGGQKGPQR